MSGNEKVKAAPEVIAHLQEMLDTLMEKTPMPFQNYARQHKLSLLDSRMKILDQALDAGVIKVKEKNAQ